MADKTTLGIDKARDLVADEVLWPRMRDFLWNFTPQIHKSWLEGLTDLDSPRVKRYALDILGIEPFFHDFPKDDGSRIALLDGSTLLDIARWLGALSSAGALRKVTSGADVRALKAALPGVYPEVFGYTAYFGKTDLAEGSAKDPDGIVADGLEYIFSLFGDRLQPLVSRAKLKLPKPLVSSLAKEGAGKRDVKGTALKKLLKLKFPEAYSLCCS